MFFLSDVCSNQLHTLLFFLHSSWFWSFWFIELGLSEFQCLCSFDMLVCGARFAWQYIPNFCFVFYACVFVCMCLWVMLLWMRLAHYNHIKTYIKETNETICIKNTILVGTKLILHQVKEKKVKMTKSAIFSDNLNFFGNQVVFHMNLYPLLHWIENITSNKSWFFFLLLI